MKIFNKKALQFLGMFFFIFLFLNNSLPAKAAEAKKSLSEYLEGCPWIGLIADEITYGPITISDVSINKGHKLAIVPPGTTLNGKVRYHIDSENLDAFHTHHLVVGIKDLGAQDCITHSYGLWDSKGNADFTLIAPEERGVYEVRFLFTQTGSCDNARNVWNSGTTEPTAASTIGIVIVE